MSAKQRASASSETDHVLEDGVFRIENWLPYEFSVVAGRVSATLARMYQERFSLSVVGWRVLAMVNSAAPITAKAVGERTAMSAVNVSRAVAQLAQLGMLKRTKNPVDNREVFLSPSPKGRAAYLQVVPLARAIEDELLADLSPEQRTQLHETMLLLSQRAATRLSDERDWRTLVGQSGKE